MHDDTKDPRAIAVGVCWLGIAAIIIVCALLG